MKILFIAAKLHTIEPFGIMSLVPYLKRDGHQVVLQEAEAPDVLARVLEFRPQIIAYSVCTGSQEYYLSFNRALKSHLDVIAVFGGPHPTFFPQIILEPGVDAICRGEGELAFAEFCRNLQLTGRLDAVPNFSVKRDGTIHSLPPRPLVRDADSFLMPDRELYYCASREARQHTIRSFLASRGCPFACTYCFNAAMDDLYAGDWKHVRVRSPGNLVDEIAAVAHQYPTEFIAFRESIFPLRLDWLQEFADLYARRIGRPFYCHLRLDMLTGQNVALLARAGCHSVNVGIETGDPELRERLLHRRITNDQMALGCALLRKHGIKILANNMLGLPGASLDHDLRTLALNHRCRPDYSLAMLWQPYPGTELARYAVRQGFYRGDGRDLDFTYYNRSPLQFRQAGTKRRVENFQKLFAVAVALPWLTPLVLWLIRLPPNPVFRAIFRTMYLVFHQTEIFPHRMKMADWGLNLRHIVKEA